MLKRCHFKNLTKIQIESNIIGSLKTIEIMDSSQEFVHSVICVQHINIEDYIKK